MGNYFGFICWTDSTNGKTYTGSHKGSIDGYTGSGTLFLRAYEKRSHKFNREILEYVYDDNRDVLLEKEQKYLNEINWNYTYNLISNARGGGLKGRKHTEEAKQKISDIHKGKPKSEAHKKALSENHKGMLNLKHKEETKQKMSIAAKGKSKSEAHKKAISNSLKGKPWTKVRRAAQRKEYGTIL